MKKIKSVLNMALLSFVLVGNVFAFDNGGSGVYSFFGSFYETMVSFVIGDDGCTPRLCTGCKPGGDGENDNCRPPTE